MDDNLLQELIGEYWNIVKCNQCDRKYKQCVTEQIPGFRDMDYDTCPYCGFENGKSMSYEYSDYPIDNI